MSLTLRQSQILRFIADHTRANGCAPTLAEIGRAHGLRSLATVHKHATNLVQAGYLQRRWNVGRSLALVVRRGAACPTCGQALPDENSKTESESRSVNENT